MDTYHLVVIGSGPAGEKAAAMAAYFDKRVAIVERERTPGGTVVRRGGIPTKTLREAATYLSGFHRRDAYGVGVNLTFEQLADVIRSRAREVVELTTKAVSDNIARHKIDMVNGTASISPDGDVRVAHDSGHQTTMAAEHVLIATGSRPLRPSTIPFNDPDVDDSDSILALTSIPESLVVIGGGPVGVEYASISTALGVHVTVIDAAPRLIPFADEEISRTLAAALEDDGARFIFESPGSTIERTDKGLDVTLPTGEVLRPDKVLFAAGRVGNIEGLGLEAAGIESDDRNHILVDEHFQTSRKGIYAAGDIVGPPSLASVSAEQGRIAISHAFGLGVVDELDSVPVYGVYSIPEVGMAGLTETAAGDKGYDVAIGRNLYSQNPRSRIAGSGVGLLKLVVDKADHKLLGTHIVGDDAAELVHIGQAALHAGEPVERFIRTTFNTPTRAEMYKYAAYDALQDITGHRLSS